MEVEVLQSDVFFHYGTQEMQKSKSLGKTWNEVVPEVLECILDPGHNT